MPNDQKSCGDELIEKLKGCSDEDIAKVKDYLAGLEEKKSEEDAKPEEATDKPAEEKQPEVKDAETPVEQPAAEATEAADAEPKKEDEEVVADAEPKKADEEQPKEECKDAKPCEDRKAVQDEAIAAYRKAESLAKRCEPLFGAIVMDGIYTEKDVAVKVCAMDSALKFVDAEKALDALSVRLDEFEKTNHGKKVTVADSQVRVTVFDFQTAFQSRK